MTQQENVFFFLRLSPHRVCSLCPVGAKRFGRLTLKYVHRVIVQEDVGLDNAVHIHPGLGNATRSTAKKGASVSL